MKFAVLMLLGGCACASSQIITSESESTRSVSMDNGKFKGITADEQALVKDMEKFIPSHPQIKLEGKKLGKMSQEEMKILQLRLKVTAKLLDNPAHQAGINEIGAKMHALSQKVKKALKWDDQGLRMWNLHMENQEFQAIAADEKAVGRDVRKFIRSRPKIRSKLKVLTTEIHDEFQLIGQRLSETGAMLDDPQQKAEIEAIGKEFAALDQTFKANLHWDDKGYRMWSLSLDPEIQQEAADVAKDIQNLERPAHELGMEFQKYKHDLETNRLKISNRFQEAFNRLNSPEHRMQLQKIEARWNALQTHIEEEAQAFMTDFEAFVQQAEIVGELKDLEMEVTKELNEMYMRSRKFQREIERELNDLLPNLDPESDMDHSKCGDGGKVDQMFCSTPVLEEYMRDPDGIIENWKSLERLSTEKIMSRSKFKIPESPSEVREFELNKIYFDRLYKTRYGTEDKRGNWHGVYREIIADYGSPHDIWEICEGQFWKNSHKGYKRCVHRNTYCIHQENGMDCVNCYHLDGNPIGGQDDEC